MIHHAKKSVIWNAYLRVPDQLTSDVRPPDAGWLAATGIGQRAPDVLALVRAEALPLVKKLEKKRLLRSFSLLVHDRSSGVPCPPGDNAPYLHLRLTFRRAVDAHAVVRTPWRYVAPVRPSKKDIEVHAVLDDQCAWYLKLVERCLGANDVDSLKMIGQHLHYFSNMAQMVVR